MRRKASKSATLTSICAALYAVGAYATAYIQSPWGMGQFRPAIVVPSVFAILFGPTVGGLGAAIGTLIADSVKHGRLYIPSLVAAVPANFVAFYLLGKLLEGKFRWPRFVTTSLLLLLVGNALCAALYTGYKALIGAIPLQLVPGLLLGLTVWWFSTMLPFQLLVTPPILRAIVKALPAFVPLDVQRECLEGKTPRRENALALATTGLLVLSLALLIYLSGEAAHLFVGGLPARLRGVVRSLIAAMFGATGVGLATAAAWVARPRRAAST